jgi:hypothetical protein
MAISVVYILIKYPAIRCKIGIKRMLFLNFLFTLFADNYFFDNHPHSFALKGISKS